MNILRITTRPFRTLRIFLALTLLIDLYACPKGAAAQSTPAASASAAPVAPSSSAAPPITGSGGTLSIESVMLEYQAAIQGAKRIGKAISRSIDAPSGSRPRVFITTGADVAGLQQVQVTLGQANILKKQITNVADQIGQPPLQCLAPQKPASATSRAKNVTYSLSLAGANKVLPTIGNFLNGVLTSGPSVSSLLQVAQTVASVNESVAPATGALADQTLVNLVAGQIPGVDVYVPGVYSPNLASTSLEHTSLFMRLVDLEDARTALVRKATLELLRPACQQKTNAAVVAQIQSQVASAAGMVNAFETSLFTGQPSVPAPGGATSSPGPSGSAVPSPAPAAPATPAPPTATAATFQQLLAGDLLLDAMVPPSPSTTPLPPYFFVSLHALESGGTTLTKSYVFGSRIYYSGGAVATFNLYTGRGTFLCSGVAFGYRGFVAAKDIGTAAMLGDGMARQTAQNTQWVLPAVDSVESDCTSNGPRFP